MRSLQSKLLSLLLIPAFALAQLICICASAAAAAPQVSDAEHAAPAHACCAGDEGDDPDAPEQQPHKHDPNCSHCAGEKQAQVEASRGKVESFANLLPFLAPVIPVLFANPADGSAVRSRSLAEWLSEPSPPPDILRVKCSLQI